MGASLHSHGGPRHLTSRPALPTQMSVATQAIPRECFFPGPISSISWLAHQCLVCNLRNFPDEVLNNIPTHTWKVGKNRRQTQATPGGQVAVIRRKETYLGGLSWAAPSRGDLYMRSQSLRSLYRDLKGVQRRVPATWSPQHLTRKASTSKRLRLWEPCGEMHKGRGGARSLPPSPRVHGQSRPLDDLLRHQVQPIHAPSVTDNQP